MPLYDEAPVTTRHPALRGRIVLADGYVEPPPPQFPDRWVEENRTLVAEDRLRLQAEGIDRECTIAPDGRADFPVLGKIRCARRTLDDVRAEIGNLLRSRQGDGEVRLSVLAADPERETVVVGMVNYEGRLRRGVTNLREAMALAGGLSIRACLAQILVVRPAEGKVVVCDYYRYAKEGDEGQNLKMWPGDIIVVTALYDPDRVPCAPEWGPIEHFFAGKIDRKSLIEALHR